MTNVLKSNSLLYVSRKSFYLLINHKLYQNNNKVIQIMQFMEVEMEPGISKRRENTHIG